jgi:Ca-activated chloride channel family protein
LCVAQLASAQDAPASAPATQEPIKVQAELVFLQVSVEDGHGIFRGDLDRSQFRIFDNGSQQELAFFNSVDTPAHIAVLLETSPAVYLIQSQHIAAAYALLDGLAQDDQLALATYDKSARVALDFTSDRGAVTRALDGMQYFLGMGELNFYDAVNSTLEWLEAPVGKKALVVLSTGLDSSSESRWKALQLQLEKTDVSVFTVALGSAIRNFKSKKAAKGSQVSFQRADAALREIAKATGGRWYFPATPDDFVKAYREISAQLSHQYLMAYVPPPHDGRVHSIEVQVLNPQGHVLAATSATAASANGSRIFARQSYLSPDK